MVEILIEDMPDYQPHVIQDKLLKIVAIRLTELKLPIVDIL